MQTALIGTVGLMLAASAFADMNPGTRIPNVTIKGQDGKLYQLDSHLKTVNLVHLWKCE